MYVHEYIVADAFRSKKSSSALLLHEQQERMKQQQEQQKHERVCYCMFMNSAMSLHLLSSTILHLWLLLCASNSAVKS